MHDKMKKMMNSKKGKKLSDVERDAKMSVVENLKQMASNMMSDKVKGLKKVTIASNDEDGLKEGLEKAEEIIDRDAVNGSAEDMAEELVDNDEEGSEDELEELDEVDDSEEDLDKKIAELMAKKEQLKKKA